LKTVATECAFLPNSLGKIDVQGSILDMDLEDKVEIGNKTLGDETDAVDVEGGNPHIQRGEAFIRVF
jgi:hypothetical protein